MGKSSIGRITITSERLQPGDTLSDDKLIGFQCVAKAAELSTASVVVSILSASGSRLVGTVASPLKRLARKQSA